MSARGWCPSVFTPMQADDGLLVRVKPTASALSAQQLAALAEAAAREGNGKVQLTSRANLQLRGFTPASAERFARSLTFTNGSVPVTFTRFGEAETPRPETLSFALPAPRPSRVTLTVTERPRFTLRPVAPPGRPRPIAPVRGVR